MCADEPTDSTIYMSMLCVWINTQLALVYIVHVVCADKHTNKTSRDISVLCVQINTQTVLA